MPLDFGIPGNSQAEKSHSRLFWADKPIPSPGPSHRRSEAVLGKFDPAGDVGIFGISEAGGAPVPHQRQLGLVLVLGEAQKKRDSGLELQNSMNNPTESRE